MEFFDAFLPIGRTNKGLAISPTNQDEALALMDRYAVAEALCFHTMARDCDPEIGNAALDAAVDHPRLHKVRAFEPSTLLTEPAADFLARALDAGVRAVLVNPGNRGVRVDRAPRILELAEALQARRVPLLVAWRRWDAVGDQIDWYALADLCRAFPDLAVVAWETRTRANRPLTDALALAPNLKVSISTIWQAQQLEAICERFGADRLVFSLGLPELDPGAFLPVVTYAGVDDATRAAIAGETIRALLREADRG